MLRNLVEAEFTGALYAVRTGDAGIRQRTEAGLRSAIGTEAGGRTLALGRNLTCYVIAADILGFRLTTLDSVLSRNNVVVCLAPLTPGTRRMIFGGYSPQWEGFYVSALGGAMYVFHRVGANYVWLRGQCPTASVLVIRLKDNEYSVRLEPVDPEAHWAGFKSASGRVWEGFYGLQRYVYEKHREEYDGDWLRVLAVGPAARVTKEGAIGSNQVKRGDLSVIDDWAGRGGLGRPRRVGRGTPGAVRRRAGRLAGL